MTLNLGDEVDRYRLVELLGSGGMGSVYRAVDPKLRRAIALKVLHQGTRDATRDIPGDVPRDVPRDEDTDPEAGTRRLLREARAAAALTHPNVVAVYDVGEVAAEGARAAVSYIAMELVIGRSLRTYVGDATIAVDTKTVFIDDATVARPLDGRAIALDPGAHSFRFVRRDGTEATATALAKEGEKAVVVGVVFATPALASTEPIAPILPVAPPTAIGSTTAPSATAHLAPPTEGSTQRSIGWVVAGAGVVGLGAGATLGIVSIAEKGRAHCDATGACDPGPLSTLRATSLGADIALGSGVLLLAIGVPLILFSPHAEPVFVTPIVGTSSAGLAFVGAW